MIRFETINEAGRRIAEMLGRENIPFEGEAIVFIGALGICVRRIQSLFHDKATDPAVVCVDTMGRYVIPVLSGHIGGANELARQIARVTGGEAVITTQSDLKGLWALDTLARDFGWGVMKLSRTEMNHAIAAFVDEQPTALVVEWDDRGTRHLVETCPPHVRLFRDYADYQAAVAAGESFALLLMVSPHHYVNDNDNVNDNIGKLSIAPRVVQYYPRVLRLGVGCQRGTSAEAAEKLLDEVRHLGYAPEAEIDALCCDENTCTPVHETVLFLPERNTETLDALLAAAAELYPAVPDSETPAAGTLVSGGLGRNLLYAFFGGMIFAKTETILS